MKRIFTAALAALTSLAALAATTVPPQIINPAGSTIGQAIISTGASSAPAWGSVAATALAPVAANTVIANATSGTAAPTAFAMPSCSTSTSAIQYTSGTGFTCFSGSAPLASPAFTGTATFAARPTFAGNTPWDSGNLPNPASTTGNLSQFASTTSAQLAGVISDETGTGLLVLASSPAIATPNIIGVTNGSSAAAGSAGEYLTAQTNTTSLTSTVAANATSLALAAGDYDAQCVARFNPAGTTTWNYALVSVNTTSAAVPGFPSFQQIIAPLTTGQQQILNSPTVRISSSGAVTAYCVVTAQFGTSTMTVDGFLRIRRVR